MREGAVGTELTRALQDFAAEATVLVALDFDGCLAPFVIDPADARPLPEAHTALQDLAGAPGTQLALVSGRPVADLNRLAAPPPGTWLVGSHGAEEADVTSSGTARIRPLELSSAQHKLLQEVTAAVEELATSHPPAWVEYKPAAVVLHTRTLGQVEAEGLLAEAMAGPGQWNGVNPIHGNQVAELAVVDATKGDSLRSLRKRLRHRFGPLAVLYAGDDVTDETALAVLQPGDVGIKVGAATTVARHHVPDEYGVAEVLTQLAQLRASPPAPGV